jgi:hypothetical protein
MGSASASNSPGVTVTSCTQAATPNLPTPPKRQPLFGAIYGLIPFQGGLLTQFPPFGTPARALTAEAEPIESTRAVSSEIEDRMVQSAKPPFGHRG